MDISAGSTLTNYTEDEVKVAQKEAGEIIKAMKTVGISMFIVIHLTYEFEQSEKYKTIGFDTVNEWIESEGYSPSTFMKYMALYRSLTIKHGISVDDYSSLDVGKVVSLKILSDHGADKEELVSSIIDVKELTTPDLIETTNDKVRRLDAGKGIEEKSDDIKNVLEDLEPGAYRIQRLEPGKDHDVDPRFNKDKIIPLNRVLTKWYYNPDNKEFTVVIR